MALRNKIAAFLVLGSFGLLVPGLTLPMLTVTVDAGLSTSFANFQVRALDQTRSILGTVENLYMGDKLLVAFLIFFFSVCVPFLKGLLLLTATFLKNPRWQARLAVFLDAIGKWSMADVFVVAVFLTYLSTTGEGSVVRETLSLLGMKIPVELRLLMDAKVGTGFYCFLAYCLVSIATLHVAKLPRTYSVAPG